MVRKKRTKAIEAFINGEPATIPVIGETVQYRHLHRKLGSYLNANELYKLAGITPTNLAGWRKKGIVKWEQVDDVYYYSKKSVLAALKTTRPAIPESIPKNTSSC
jgi:hypothetical protein